MVHWKVGIQQGPDSRTVLRRSQTRGRRYGLVSGAGILAGTRARQSVAAAALKWSGNLPIVRDSYLTSLVIRSPRDFWKISQLPFQSS